MVNIDSLILISELAKIADDVILPRYLALKDGDIEEKSPDELVTIADCEAEECITCCLRFRLLGAGLHYLETSSTS